jgi:hypothetical protein
VKPSYFNCPIRPERENAAVSIYDSALRRAFSCATVSPGLAVSAGSAGLVDSGTAGLSRASVSLRTSGSEAISAEQPTMSRMTATMIPSAIFITSFTLKDSFVGGIASNRKPRRLGPNIGSRTAKPLLQLGRQGSSGPPDVSARAPGLGAITRGLDEQDTGGDAREPCMTTV